MPTADPPEERRRARGGQPGNANALKSGAFVRARLTAHTLELLEDAKARTPGELADLLWVLIVRELEAGDADMRNVAALATALVRAELAAMKLVGSDADTRLTEALGRALADVGRAKALADA